MRKRTTRKTTRPERSVTDPTLRIPALNGLAHLTGRGDLIPACGPRHHGKAAKEEIDHEPQNLSEDPGGLRRRLTILARPLFTDGYW